MKLFFDENFSPFLARGFACFQDGRKSENIEVIHVVDQFGKGTKDEVWIPKIAQMHGAAITQDYNIHRTRQLAELCRSHKLGIFFFRPPKKTSLKYWELVSWVMNSWHGIKQIAVTETPPYVFLVTPKGKSPERL